MGRNMGMVESSVSILAGRDELYETTGRKPNPVDVHVGSRVRYRRMIIGMSQEKLGEKMNLTFQQIQKYEKGTNRIGASRLFQLSKILEVPVGYFFEDAFPAAPSMRQCLAWASRSKKDIFSISSTRARVWT